MFLKKLIPHIYMSKDEFPQTMTPNDVLEKMFLFMEDWKSKLYDMISFNSVPRTEVPVLQIPNQVRHTSNISSSAVKRSIGFTMCFHNHREGPYHLA